MKRIGYILSIIVILLGACRSEEDKRLDVCLQSAGGNRGELEKVLKHYKNDPEKLRAARFLLSNMLYKYTYTDKNIDSLKKVLKVAIPNKGVIPQELKDKWKKVKYRTDLKEFDIQVIKADLLIENIDLAFEAWKRRSWSKCYSFGVFCDYILPYRLGNEPLERWRRLYYDHYAHVLDSLYQGTDAVEAAELLHKYYMKERTFVHNTALSMPHLGALYLWDNNVGYCRDKIDFLCYAMRAAGIPVASDSYYVSNTYVGNHTWLALIDTTGRVIPVESGQETRFVRDSLGGRKRGKIYRKMYSIQYEKIKGQYKDETLHARFRQPYLKDATGEYRVVDRFEIKIDNEQGEKYAYLSIFDGRRFDPIDAAIAEKRKVVFQDVEPDMIYQVTINRGGEFVPVGDPFWLDGSSAVRYFHPDEKHRVKIRLNRKFPDNRVKKHLETAVGVRIEGANRRDFKDAELLCQIVDSPKVNYNVIILPEVHKFRYIRYQACKERFVELAEFAVYGDTLQHQKWIPMLIEADTIVSKEEKEKIPVVNDENWVRYYKSGRKGGALVFDYGKQVPVLSLVYVPHNDGNFVRVGDTYELFYQNGIQGWVSLGKQIATSAWLTYDNVPRNALLWLRNHTHGKEERAFFYDDGRQVFP